jgi:predicted TIM-barrel fold metal-dependent hydrolase
VDYPFADNQQARDWFDRLDLAPEAREKIAHGTADTLLHLNAADTRSEHGQAVPQ